MERTPRFLGVVWSVGGMGLLRPGWLLFVSLMGTAGVAGSPEGPYSPSASSVSERPHCRQMRGGGAEIKAARLEIGITYSR